LPHDQRGTDVLVETPYEALTDTFEEMIFGIMLRGFRILLAHPERSVSFQRDIGSKHSSDAASSSRSPPMP